MDLRSGCEGLCDGLDSLDSGSIEVEPHLHVILAQAQKEMEWFDVGVTSLSFEELQGRSIESKETTKGQSTARVPFPLSFLLLILSPPVHVRSTPFWSRLPQLSVFPNTLLLLSLLSTHPSLILIFPTFDLCGYSRRVY